MRLSFLGEYRSSPAGAILLTFCRFDFFANFDKPFDNSIDCVLSRNLPVEIFIPYWQLYIREGLKSLVDSFGAFSIGPVRRVNQTLHCLCALNKNKEMRSMPDSEIAFTQPGFQQPFFNFRQHIAFPLRLYVKSVNRLMQYGFEQSRAAVYFNTDDTCAFPCSIPKREPSGPGTLSDQVNRRLIHRVFYAKSLDQIIETFLFLRLKVLCDVGRRALHNQLMLRPYDLEKRRFESIQCFSIPNRPFANLDLSSVSSSDYLRQLRKLIHGLRSALTGYQCGINSGKAGTEPCWQLTKDIY